MTDAEILGVTIDCHDVTRVAAFWRDLLGLHQDDSRPGWSYLVHPEGRPPRLTFQPVDEPRQGKVRIHLDLRVADMSAAKERVVELGGSLTGEEHTYPDGQVVVVADPEGHELCLVWFAGG